MSQPTFGNLSGHYELRYRDNLHASQVAHQSEAYPGQSYEATRSISIPPSGWDASPPEGYPQH